MAAVSTHKENSYFCHCGSLLCLQQEGERKFLRCVEGHEQPFSRRTEITEQNKSSRPVEVGSEKNFLAVHDHHCPKCGYDKAELIEISCSYSDEDNCYRMKCGKCGFVKQLEGKVK